MSARRRLDWLGLTPEPERELPAAVAALRAASGAAPGAAYNPAAVRAELAAAERRRVERLVLRGSRHSWLRYLAEVTALVTSVAARTAGADDVQSERGGQGRLDGQGIGDSQSAGSRPGDGQGQGQYGGDGQGCRDSQGDGQSQGQSQGQGRRRAPNRAPDPHHVENTPPPPPDDHAAALLAAEVVLDHHRMLIGLPGAGYGRTSGDRAALERAVRTLRTQHPRTGESR
ncbi:hypothetical protein ACFVZW_07395 [Streptomyces sp. NPDC059567]|uniref:hypothetical protein n=1 Tax=Streptomyces sp. NPDC059567 TaxID=3346867 RepID=UPI0036884DAB